MSLTRRGRVVVALGIVAAFALGLVGGSFLYLRSIGLVGHGDPGRKVALVIPQGASASRIGELLEQRGVVPSALGFRLAAYLEGGGGDIQAGRYRLPRDLSARGALAALGRGPRVEFVTVTFPEGSWLTDFARIAAASTDLSRARFLRVARSSEVRSKVQPRSVASLEGLLWPSTYQVDEEDTERSVIERLVAELEAQLSRVDIREARARGYEPYDVVVIASMIEAEARVAGDRSRIAAVIYNRLDEGMPLGIDATVLYAVGKRGGVLTTSDLDIDSPFNTRRYAGLPPTPIGAPGLASLQAAGAPAEGPWLYYVLADCAGHHAFSTDYDDFLADKAAYQALEC
ncbi:endolytic transglycosylase MltG [soil metagenome]